MVESMEIIDCNYLFNLLNSEYKYPCLSDPHFLLLLDARSVAHYNESHIITAKTIRKFGEDFLVCEEFEVENRTHIAIYDHDFDEKNPNPSTIQCSNTIWESGARFPIKILKGGYILFSSIYPFLKTRKVLYMPKELDDFETYPSEIIPGFLYLGRSLHAEKPSIQKDLKITRHVNCSDCPSKLYPNISKNILTLNIPYTVDSSIYFRFQTVCDFIDFNYDKPKGVLIYSKYGVNSNAAIAIVYYLYLYDVTYKEAYDRIKECCPKIHLSRKMEELLRRWEIDVEKNPFSHRNRSIYNPDNLEKVKSGESLRDITSVSEETRDVTEDVFFPRTSNSDEKATYRLNDISSLYFEKITEKNRKKSEKLSQTDLETWEEDVNEEDTENEELLEIEYITKNPKNEEAVETTKNKKETGIDGKFENDGTTKNVEKKEDQSEEANDDKKLESKKDENDYEEGEDNKEEEEEITEKEGKELIEEIDKIVAEVQKLDDIKKGHSFELNKNMKNEQYLETEDKN